MRRRRTVAAPAPGTRPTGLEEGLAALAVRLGAHPRAPEFGEIVLHRRRVFVLPTRAGLMFGAALLIMLLTAVNYQLALGYALTFLMTGAALVSLIHTWRNLVGIGLRAGRAEPVYAGELIEWSVVCKNLDRQPRYALELSVPGTAQAHLCDLEASSEHLLQVALPGAERGVLQVPRLRLSTCWPLGLWRAWAWWQPATRLLVWPHLENPAAPLPESSSQGVERPGPGQDNFAAIRPYRPGDTPRRLAWKAMARLGSDDLLMHQFEGGCSGQLEFRWDALPAFLAPELRLSRLARWVVDAEAAGMHYALSLPAQTLALASGPAHRTACLDALAMAEV